MQAAIIDRLRAEFDATTILTGADIGARYHTDMAGVAVDLPVAVLRPRTTEDVSRMLRVCHAARVPVTTQGGMTGLVRATMPEPNEIVLSMERMSAIEEVDTSGGVVTRRPACHCNGCRNGSSRTVSCFRLISARGEAARSAATFLPMPAATA